MSRLASTLGLCWLSASAILSGCATTRSNQAPPGGVHGAHEVSCKYVGLEDVSGPNDTNADYVTLMAAYSFGEPRPAKPEKPVSLKFQVTRSRVSEFRDYLASRPETICRPEGGSYSAHVAPFAGARALPQHD